MAIERDTVTIWHNSGTPKLADWHRTTVTNVRVDWSVGNVPSAAGPTVQDQMTCYLWTAVDVVAGDRIMVGPSSETEPPMASMRVSRVQPWTDDGRFEHMEVTAR
jgi:hypothetical protein